MKIESLGELSILFCMSKTLIKNCSIVTQDSKRKIIPRGYLIIDNNIIKEVGSGQAGNGNVYSRVIDASGLIATPGFINSHVHLGESIYRNLLKTVSNLEDYLKKTDFLSKNVAKVESSRNVICDYSALLLLHCGTSTICGGRTNLTGEKWGIRNVSGYMLMRSPKLGKYYDSFLTDVGLEKNTELTYPAIFIQSLSRIDLNKLIEVRDILLANRSIKLFIHIAETKKEYDSVVKQYGVDPIALLDEYKLLSSQTVIIHGNWLKEKDLKKITKRGSGLVPCLSSNLLVADKTIDLRSAMKQKVKIGLGTDGLSTSGRLNILEEARINYFYHNRFSGNKIKSQVFFDMITNSAAKMLSLDKEIGSLEKGKKADIAFFENSLLMDRDNIVDSLIIFGSTPIAYGLIIDGKIKLWNGKLLEGNNIENNVKNKFAALQKKVDKKWAQTVR